MSDDEAELVMRVRAVGPDGFELHLPAAERELLRSLPGQLRELLAADDPSVYRLFPPAYPEDPDREAEYRRLVRDDLLSGHLAALETVEATIGVERLDEEQLVAWLSALNDLRL